MSETHTPPTEKSFAELALQELIDAWEARPRRQLDYSMLTAQSEQDIEWTNRVIKALIPVVPGLCRHFKMAPTPPIVVKLPVKTIVPANAVEPQQAAEQRPVVGHPTNAQIEPQREITPPATQKGRARGKDAGSRSRKATSKPEKQPRSRSQAKASPPDRTASNPDPKADTSSKPASADAKPTSEQKAETKSEPTSTTSAGADLTDPPSPKLTEIG